MPRESRSPDRGPDTARVRPDGGDEETPLEQVVTGVVVGAVLLTAFTLLALGFDYFWVAFVVGFAGVLPAAVGLTKLYERRRERRREVDAPSAEEAALATLRERYASGELTETEFETRVERLLRTESVDDAEAYVREVRASRTTEETQATPETDHNR